MSTGSRTATTERTRMRTSFGRCILAAFAAAAVFTGCGDATPPAAGAPQPVTSNPAGANPMVKWVPSHLTLRVPQSKTAVVQYSDHYGRFDTADYCPENGVGNRRVARWAKHGINHWRFLLTAYQSAKNCHIDAYLRITSRKLITAKLIVTIEH